MANYSAISIANWFLERAAHDGEMLTNLKIQKLLHIANGWHLHFANGEALFPDNIEAWYYGPVIPNVYQSFKKFGAGSIVSSGKAPTLSGKTQEIVEAVWKSYGGISALTLVAMTHKPGTPWSQTYKDGEGQGDVISPELIKGHYAELAKQSQQAH